LKVKYALLQAYHAEHQSAAETEKEEKELLEQERIARITQQVEDLTRMRDEHMDKALLIENERDSIKELNAHLIAEISEAKQQVACVCLERDGIVDDALHAASSALEAEKETTNTRIAELTEEIQAVKATGMKETQSAITELQAKINDVHEQLKQSDTERALYRAQVAELHGATQDATNEAKHFKDQYEASIQQILALNEDFAMAVDVKNSISSQLNRVELEAREREKNMEMLISECNNLREELERMSASMNSPDDSSMTSPARSEDILADSRIDALEEQMKRLAEVQFHFLSMLGLY
jgi:chromosome segregation ATPase